MGLVLDLADSRRAAGVGHLGACAPATPARPRRLRRVPLGGRLPSSLPNEETIPMPDTIRLYGLVTDSIVDGPGFRTVHLHPGLPPPAAPAATTPAATPLTAGTVYPLADVESEVLRQSPPGRRHPHRRRAVLPGRGLRAQLARRAHARRA